MNIRITLLSILCFVPVCLIAQPSTQWNAAEIRQGLGSLNVSGSVLYIAAHPDDENTRLLAYLAKEKKVRTGYLSLTRGDGGQNLIGTEQGDLLGLIRTQELLAARRMDGAQQFFTRANDFGFSKTSDEALKIWGRAQILSDVVWVIRNFQPDVIITRFPEDARAGHGHHQASAILAREAFAAAADPKQFPEQLRYVKVWQAKRIVWNTFNFGSGDTTSPEQLKIDVGAYNPLMGKSYGEIAAESRSNHKSQGFGSPLQRGSAIEFFTHVAGDAATRDIFEGLNFTLQRDKGTDKVQKMLNLAIQAYDPASPSQSLPALLALKTAAKNLPFKHQLLDELIVACAGIWVEATANQPAYALNDDIQVNINAIARPDNSFRSKITIQELNSNTVNELYPNHLLTIKKKIDAKAVGLTQPYWLEKEHPIGTYVVDSLSRLGMPEASAPQAGTLRIGFGNQFVDISRPIIYKHTDPVKGEVYQPLVVAPPVTVTPGGKAFVFNGQTPQKIAAQLKAFMPDAVGDVIVKTPRGWKASPEKIHFDLRTKGELQNIEIMVTPTRNAERGKLSFVVAIQGQEYNKGLRTIEYDHIPQQTLFPLSEARLERIDLKTAGRNIGYVPGAGDLIPEALTQIGYQVTRLTEKQVLESDLSSFDAIVTGVRLYNVNENIGAMQPKLLDYVKNGGTLLVQYNVNTKLKTDQLGPYPFTLRNERVTEEDAKVEFLAPQHPALNFPNKISSKDFDGWIQERGLYFTSDIDPHYTAILGMHDTDAPQSNGSLIIAPYGNGKFVYTSLAFFRELPAGVPGAYRLFVNLLSKSN